MSYRRAAPGPSLGMPPPPLAFPQGDRFACLGQQGKRQVNQQLLAVFIWCSPLATFFFSPTSPSTERRSESVTPVFDAGALVPDGSTLWIQRSTIEAAVGPVL